MVIYRTRKGYDLPAVITATVATLDPAGVEQYRQTFVPERAGVNDIDPMASGVPPLASPEHVHLTVFSPGLPGNPSPTVELGIDANAGGSYREWDVPLFEPTTIPDPRPGAVPQPAPIPAGSWRWPERT
jgi:hypothetical protein